MSEQVLKSDDIGKNEKGDITINGKSILRVRPLPKDVKEDYNLQKHPKKNLNN